MTDIAQSTPPIFHLDAEGNLTIPDGTNRQAWEAGHTAIVRYAKCSRRWLAASREYGLANFGEEAVSATESQALLDLGIALPPPASKPDVNGEGKARGLTTIEGVSQSFAIWQRTVERLIPKWTATQIRQALTYIEPIEAEAKRLRALLADDAGSSGTAPAAECSSSAR